MKTRTNDFKIGVFVLVGIGLLLGALFIFGASKIFEGKTVEETYIAGDVGGLKVGALVTLNGVPVGEVTKINFSWNVYHRPEPRYVVIEFEVHNRVSLVPPGKDFARHVQEEINKGLRARIKSQGLAGATVVSLEYLDPAEHPPLKVPWKPRHIYIPSAPGQFSEIISAVDKTMSKVKQIDFQKIGELVQGDLAAAEKLLKHLDQANLNQAGTNMNALITDLRGVSAQLKSFIGQTNRTEQTANLEKISKNADDVLLELHTTVGRLNEVLTKFDAASLNQTLKNMQRATQSLDDAVRQFKQYPSGALFGKPPPPARSVESPKQNSR
jgi:ABC-type transporter Mla subunit MlaD